jgi:hypothetical protein
MGIKSRFWINVWERLRQIACHSVYQASRLRPNTSLGLLMFCYIFGGWDAGIVGANGRSPLRWSAIGSTSWHNGWVFKISQPP